MEEWIRNNIMLCLESRMTLYVENINRLLGDKESEFGDVQGAIIWINLIHVIIDFVDNKKLVKINS